MSAVDLEHAAAEVRRLVGQMSPLGPREPASEDRIIEDLGYDSLAIVEMAMTLETELDLDRIPEEAAIDVVTVKHLEELVIGILRRREDAS